MKDSNSENLKEKLFRKTKTGWEGISSQRKEEIFSFCDEYMDFLNNSKTEREIVKSTKNIIEKNGFKNIREYSKLNPGDKVYYNNRDR